MFTRLTCSNIIQIKKEFNGIIYHNYQICIESRTQLAVREILKINDIYTEFIGENPLDPFRNLNEKGKQKVLDYIDLLEKSGEYEKKTAEIIDITPRLMMH